MILTPKKLTRVKINAVQNSFCFKTDKINAVSWIFTYRGRKLTRLVNFCWFFFFLKLCSLMEITKFLPNKMGSMNSWRYFWHLLPPLRCQQLSIHWWSFRSLLLIWSNDKSIPSVYHALVLKSKVSVLFFEGWNEFLWHF